MTPPRGIVRPAIQAVLAALMVACAAAGAIGRRLEPRRQRPKDTGQRCERCGRPLLVVNSGVSKNECDRRVLP